MVQDLDMTDMNPDEELERLAELYVATHVTVEINGGWVSAPVAVRLIGQPLHVITAWNPGDDRPTDAQNEAANSLLLSDLEILGTRVLRALGSDPNSDHAEKSWAVAGISDESAIELGVKYGQVAIFRLEAESQTVLSCDGTWSRSRDYSQS